MSNSTMSTPPPPPSAFSHYANLAESSAAAVTRSDRHSRRTNSAGPRPLHLAAGSVVGSAPASPARAASPLLPDEGSTTSPYSPRAGPSTPMSPTITGLRNGSARRQSSISYKSSGGHSPSPSQGSFGGKRDSLDMFSLGPAAARSPLSANAAGFQESHTSGLARSSSLGARRTTGAKVAEQPPRASVDGTERAPVTLVEKHAELLHFIAQKESKCLELRSQLAVHEAELLELKKKWERIVNRGFERSQAGASGKPSSSPTSTSGLGPAFTTSKSDSSSVNSASYFPTLLPAPTAPSAIVLEGIKEGVQGVSRLLAAGLETIAQVNAPTTDGLATKRAITPEPAASRRSISPHPAAGLTSTSELTSRKGGHGHEQKESQSSTTSAASNASMASSLLSVSTASSATSATPSEGSYGGLTTPTGAKIGYAEGDADPDSEFGAFADAQMQSQNVNGHGAVVVRRTGRDGQEQEVLMVRDTGATPTMSPNPDFQRRVLQPSEPGVDDGFDWDDGWGNLDGDSTGKDGLDPLDVPLSQPMPAQPPPPPTAKPAPNTSSSSNTGLTSKVASAPAAQQMSSWVGSMGKKWGEIKGSQTFTKSQKRATLLLSDMQQSLVSALISPTPLSASASSDRSPSQRDGPANPLASPSSSSASPFSSNASHKDASVALSRSLSPSAPSRAPPPSATRLRPSPGSQAQAEMSLLDDSDESFGEEAEDTVRLTMSAPVMVPTAAPTKLVRQASSSRTLAAGTKAGSSGTSLVTKDDTEEDEWNW